MRTAEARIVLPLRRAAPAERLLLVKPWFLREDGERAFARRPSLDEQHATPQILTFTSDDFVESFFASVAGTAPLPKLTPFRDWSEPPAAMTDASGAPRFPAQIQRQDPVLEVESYTPASELDADGVPHGDPRWLRKLYLGIHRHFQIVTTEVVCRRFDAPRLAGDRLLGAGMVVRRLMADPSRQRWQDWIAAPGGGGGIWREIADASMRSTGGDVVDPEALAPEVFGTSPERCALLLRLGHDVDCSATPLTWADELLPAALASHALSLIPAVHGDAAQHSAYFGYLPLSSSDLIRPEPPPANVTQLAQKLRESARVHLAAELFELELTQPQDPIALDPHAIAHFGQVGSSILTALQDVVVRTVRPTGASTNSASSSMNRALDLALRRAMNNWWDDFDDNRVGSPQSWWNNGPQQAALQELKDLTAMDQLDGATLGFSVITTINGQSDTVLRSLLTGRMKSAVAALWFGSSASKAFRGDSRRAMLCLALRRVRTMRRSLAEAIYPQVHPAPADTPDLDTTRRLTKPTGALDVPAHTVSSLSGEIDAWLEASDQQSQWPRPWGTLTVDANQEQVHEACTQLEAILSDLDRRGAGAGSAYVDELAQLGESVDTGVFAGRLCQKGLDVDEQPLRGLFVFPAWIGDTGSDEFSATAFAATAAATANRVADRYQTSAADLVDTEGDALQKTVQPRYDSNRLYAVQCWVRVRSQDPCAADHLLWTEPSEPFSTAEVTDLLGAQPVAFQLPDFGKLVRDIPRIAKAKANPFAAVTTPPNSGVNTGEEMDDTTRQWGIAWICSFGIPVFTICAWILFSIILAIILMIPGFAWLLLLKFCIPVPKPE